MIGGYVYSLKENPWEWLTSKEAAESMAERVAEWPNKYNCDGINLDLEDGAGNRFEAIIVIQFVQVGVVNFH
jgi:hypothetical protein